jgi:large subunit ribosomal protein L24
MKRIIKGDKVRVISGKYKTQEGIVLSVNNKANKAIVEGINKAKVHQKAQQGKDKGQIVEKELPIDMSKLALVVAKSSNGISKVSFSTQKDGKKIRIAKRSGTELSKSTKK